MRRHFPVVGLAWLCMGLGLIQTARAADALPADRGVGWRVPDFHLKDTLSGESFSLRSFFGKKALVIVFTGTDCPVGNLYLPRLVELAETYKPKGVALLAINANASESAEQVAAHARSFHTGFPVLKDPGNVVADQFLAESTCEALVIDGRGVLRYRGAIDDQYQVGARREAPGHRYLVDALDALLDGRAPAVKGTDVAGCPIERAQIKEDTRKNLPRVRPAPDEIVRAYEDKEPAVKVGEVTFAADVAPIVQSKCQGCHRPGQAAPFSLLTYDQARRWAASISDVVDERRMPPWHADPRYGHFANDRSLSARERATLLAWVEQGAPLGDAAKLPAPRKFPEGWSIGMPDLVIEMPETYIVAAQGVLPYQYFRVPSGFTEDRWIQAAEARPGDRSVVHHVLVFVDDHTGPRGALGAGPGGAARGGNPGAGGNRGGGGGGGARRFDSHLCGYAPGDLPTVYAPGTAKKVPAGSDLIFQVHYTPNGKRKTDRSSVGFVFAKEPPRYEAHTLSIAQRTFTIPPGAENYEVTSTVTLPGDCLLLALMPHMHLRGKDFRYTVTYPDGKSEILLSVPAYDFGWQSAYRLAEPKRLPKGTRIDCVAHFDNSAHNPANPDPNQAVRWGEQTFEEMMIGYLDYSIDRQGASGGKAFTADAARRGSGGAAAGLRQVLRALVRPAQTAETRPGADRPSP